MQGYKDVTDINAQLGNNKIGMNITYVTPLHRTAFVHNVPGYGTTNRSITKCHLLAFHVILPGCDIL